VRLEDVLDAADLALVRAVDDLDQAARDDALALAVGGGDALARLDGLADVLLAHHAQRSARCSMELQCCLAVVGSSIKLSSTALRRHHVGHEALGLSEHEYTYVRITMLAHGRCARCDA
jgi:hypothetical protein